MKTTTLIIICIFSYACYKGNAQSLTIKPNGTAASVKNQPANTRDGSSNLGNSYYKSAPGLNYVSASALSETRSGQDGFNIAYGWPDTLVITGLPSNAIIDTAFVFLGASYTESNAPTASISITNPNSVNNTYPCVTTGTSLSVCWDETGTAGYCAGVKPAITGNGTYNVNVSGFENADNEVDGATLFIVYTNPDATTTGTLVIADGCEAYQGESLYFDNVLTGFTGCSKDTDAQGFVIAGDIQSNDAAYVSFEVNGVSDTFPRNFWDLYTVNTTVTLSQTSATFIDDDSTGDCYFMCMEGIYFQCVTTGIQQTNPLGSIEVYPNPVKNSLYINLHNPVDGTISITDVLGQQVYGEKISGASTEQIEMNSFSNGVYFLTIESQGERLVKQVVKIE